MKTFIKKQIISLVAIIATLFSSASCVDNKFDFPIEDLYDHGLVANINIAGLKAMYQNSTVAITQDLIVAGNVCSSDREGNIFKTLYIQDETGGLPIVIDQSNINNNYRVGRKVLVKLKGLYLGAYSGLIQLGMAPDAGETSPSRLPATVVSDYIVKDYEVSEIEPEAVTISQIANRDELIGKLIKIDDVQFAAPDATYATADANTNRTIEDRDGNTIIMRNSSYATFALLPLPAGSGSLTAVLSVFVQGSTRTYQLLVRDTADVAFHNPRFGGGSGGTGEVILRETFGNTAVQTGTAWPSVADYAGYLKEGKGAAQVTYTAEGGTVSVRSNAASSGYSGASGECNAMMAAASGATLLVNDIATCGARNLVLSFGINETSSIFSVAYKINGTSNWVPVTYTKTDAAWGLSSANITLPTGANTIKLRFTATATTYGARVDDIKITTEDQTSNPIIDPDGTGGGGGTGAGSQTNPYNVAEGISHQGSTDIVWTQGYIVGCVKNGVTSVGSASDVIIGAGSGWDSQTNVLIADDPNETDYTKCIAVNLPSQKPLRTEVNLVTHPENYKKTLSVKGILRTYFGISGLRDSDGETADFVLDGQGSGGGTGGNDIFNETLLTQTSFDKFTAYSITGTQAWNFDAQYGAVMSGYDNSTTSSYANVDWFISPAIDLSGKSSVKLKFDHARGPAASITVGVSQGWYKVYVSNNYNSGDPTSATWTEITGVTHGTTAWAYVSSGELNIPTANLAANCRIAFRYECSNTESATWEVRNVTVFE